MNSPLKIISWNVNGLRAAIQKNLFQSVAELDADIIALQETKLQEHHLTEEIKDIYGYESFWAYSTEKKGYSGVAIYSRKHPLDVSYGIGIPEFDNEGRIIQLDFGKWIFFNIYFPNGQKNEERLQYKLNFYAEFFKYADTLKKNGQSIIIAGDFNTAHEAIDLKNPKANENYSGFLRIERDWLDRIIEQGYVDTFRYKYPDSVQYSWWTYRFNARKKNVGWRIDYFFVTRNIIDNGYLMDAMIYDTIYGSDHCPIGLLLQFP
ncbi:MAG: exodeoxyribonuclease III [Desulfobacterales bacterium]|nr:exodeoxyribonuclease III [Desulfobacterales bacterium]